MALDVRSCCVLTHCCALCTSVRVGLHPTPWDRFDGVFYTTIDRHDLRCFWYTRYGERGSNANFDLSEVLLAALQSAARMAHNLESVAT